MLIIPTFVITQFYGHKIVAPSCLQLDTICAHKISVLNLLSRPQFGENVTLWTPYMLTNVFHLEISLLSFLKSQFQQDPATIRHNLTST